MDPTTMLQKIREILDQEDSCVVTEKDNITHKTQPPLSNKELRIIRELLHSLSQTTNLCPNNRILCYTCVNRYQECNSLKRYCLTYQLGAP